MAVRADETRMMIVDSNAWADFFNGAATPHVERLDAALREEEEIQLVDES